MERKEILKQLEFIFKEVFDEENISLSLDSSSDNIDGWDSLAHIQIVSAIQKEFGIRINAREMMEWNNVGDMVETINNKING